MVKGVPPRGMELVEGRRPSVDEKRSISSSPVTNSGSEIPTIATALTMRSPLLSARTPAHIPASTAEGTATRNANTARYTEGHKRCSTMSATGRFCTRESPKSPCTVPPIQRR